MGKLAILCRCFLRVGVSLRLDTVVDVAVGVSVGVAVAVAVAAAVAVGVSCVSVVV